MIANASDVKACLERVLALMAERDKINEGIAGVIEEYKPKGVLGKGIRRVATLRRMDPGKRRSDEQLYTDYEDALGALPEAVDMVRNGSTYDEAAEATGLSRATVARMVKAAREVAKGQENETLPAHDPETGELSETPELDTPAGGDGGTAENEAASAPVAAEESCGQPDLASEAVDENETVASPGPQDPPTSLYQRLTGAFAPAPAEDDLTLPAFLDRRLRAAAKSS